VNMERGPEVVFEVGPETPVPSSLGDLSGTPPEVVDKDLATRSGSCSAEARIAQTEIALVPASAAAPWIDVLHFETMVDGRPWHYSGTILGTPPPGTSPDGRARDRVFVVCASNDPWVGNGLAEGTHVVTMRATLPGTTQVISSSSLEVKLSCTDTPPDDDTEDMAGMGAKGGCSTGGSNAAAGVVIALMALVRRRSRSAVVCHQRSVASALPSRSTPCSMFCIEHAYDSRTKPGAPKPEPGTMATLPTSTSQSHS
jgi:hypothetical protein